MLNPRLPAEACLTLGEGGTPLVDVPGVAAAMGLRRLAFKREDLNPTGSHKDRGAAFQVSAYKHTRPALSGLVVSSSGNAAISGAAYARKAGLALAAFVAPGTARGKLERLLREGALVVVTRRAITMATEVATALDVPNLRPSTDPLAVEGFLTIGWELAEARSAADADDVFIFASSGTSFVALGRSALRSGDVGATWEPRFHVVQGTGAHPIAGQLDRRSVPDRAGTVGAFGARKTRRVGEAVRLARGSGGAGWVVTDEEAWQASHLLERHGIATSLESAASVAAAARAAAEAGVESAIVVLTGRRRSPAQEAFAGGRATSEAEEQATDLGPGVPSLPIEDRGVAARGSNDAALAVVDDVEEAIALVERFFAGVPAGGSPGARSSRE